MRRVTTYNAFMSEMLPNIRAENARRRGETIAEWQARYLRICGTMWRATSRKERRSWKKHRDEARAKARQHIDPLDSFIAAAQAVPEVDSSSTVIGLSDADFLLLRGKWLMHVVAVINDNLVHW